MTARGKRAGIVGRGGSIITKGIKRRSEFRHRHLRPGSGDYANRKKKKKKTMHKSPQGL
jgi:hypothetical protein